LATLREAQSGFRCHAYLTFATDFFLFTRQSFTLVAAA
jgi:hypothetical protein